MTALAPPAAATEHSRATLWIASLATLAAFLDTTVLFVAFPDIAATFSSASTAELSWVLNSYTIVFAALLIPAGKIADRVGHRRAFLVGSTAFTLASMACGLAPDVWSLIVFRVVQAFGGAVLIPASLALVMHAFTRDQLPRAVAVWGVAGAVAGALGPTLGAAIVEGLGWRWAFFINLPVGVVTVVLGRRHLHESADETVRRPSMVGVVLVAASASVVSYAVVETETYGWGSGRTLVTLCVGIAMAVAFVVHQRVTEAPVLNLDLFSIPTFRWCNLAGVAFGVAFTAMFLGSILYLTEVWGWSILEAGIGIAPGPAFVAVLAPRFGTLAGRVGQRPILIAGGVLYALGGAYRLVALGAEPDYFVDYLPSVVLTGIGVACCLPQLSSAVAQSLPANRIGIGGASLQSARQLGGSFGVALAVAFIGRPSGIAEAVANFERVWWVIIVGGAATAALVARLPK